MSDTVRVQRVLPEFHNPAMAQRFSQAEFDSLEKTAIDEQPSAYAGHAGTVVWYEEDTGYIVEVRFADRRSIYTRSPCSFEPTFGIDKFDGMLIQDVEDYVLLHELGRPTNRLTVYGDRTAATPAEYLRARGFLADDSGAPPLAPRRPWWRFW
jgi:hypothetical protein